MTNSCGFQAEAGPDFAQAMLPVVVAENQKRVGGEFWDKMVRAASRIPFAHDAVAAYFCTVDPNTPARVRGILLAALAYFILPVDAIPDVFIGIGFTDDAAVLAAALALVSGHIKPHHRRAAAKALNP